MSEFYVKLMRSHLVFRSSCVSTYDERIMFMLCEGCHRKGSKKKRNLRKAISEKHRLNMNDSRGHLYDSGGETSTRVFSLIFDNWFFGKLIFFP